MLAVCLLDLGGEAEESLLIGRMVLRYSFKASGEFESETDRKERNRGKVAAKI